MSLQKDILQRNSDLPFYTYPLESTEYSSILESYKIKAQELIQPHTIGTSQEYLGYALIEACEAAKDAWGVGAVIVIFHNGQELIIKGRNRIFETEDPRFHAEGDAMTNMFSIMRAAKSGILLNIEQEDLLSTRTILRPIQNPEYIKKRFLTKNIDTLSAMEFFTFAQ